MKPRVAGQGRPALMGSKVGGDRIQGRLTKEGSIAFEAARRRLARLLRLPVDKIGDADTVEYLACGKTATLRRLGRK